MSTFDKILHWKVQCKKIVAAALPFIVFCLNPFILPNYNCPLIFEGIVIYSWIYVLFYIINKVL